jgi:two-component system sensor histidine kinase MprB
VSLRTKLVAALVLLTVTASVAVAWFSYRATADRLMASVDASLADTTHQYQGGGPGHDDHRPPGPGPGPDSDTPVVGRGEVVQLLNGSGSVVSATSVALPVTALDRAVASGTTRYSVTRNVTVDGVSYRLMTSPRDGGAVQVARDLTDTDQVLTSLRNRTLFIVALVAAAAALAGWLIARQVTRRLVRLTATAEEVAATGRLDVPVPVEGHDEAGRLGVAFNRMLTALGRSRDDQQRLVQDAGHELRTPLTSLRTNITVLRRHRDLPPASLAAVLDDLDSEAHELSNLVNELVELATDQRGDEPEIRILLAALAERVAARARRRTGRAITVDADTSEIDGRPQALERALGNLVENAAKFDEDGTESIEVQVRAGRVTVLDRGPGVDPNDVGHLFDRFYRAVSARSRPGSGLGLAIVRDIVIGHGGTVFAEPRPGGGLAIGFALPLARPEDSNQALTQDGATSQARLQR